MSVIYSYNIGVSYAKMRNKVTDYIIDIIKPKMVFDIGMGVGAYGIDIKKNSPEIIMIGLDGCMKYLTSVFADKHYDVLMNSNIDRILDGTIKLDYDLIICMDVIEHLEKSKAIELLNMFDKACISTPLFWYEQGIVEGNALEKHQCWFTENELNELGYKTLYKIHYDERGDIGAFTKGL